MKPHIHHDQIIAFAMGHQIEEFVVKGFSGGWKQTNNPNWDVDTKYRVAPKEIFVSGVYRPYLWLDGEEYKVGVVEEECGAVDIPNFVIWLSPEISFKKTVVL
jgi:hypothetical protein